jgi:hypothetical protein
MFALEFFVGLECVAFGVRHKSVLFKAFEGSRFNFLEDILFLQEGVEGAAVMRIDFLYDFFSFFTGLLALSAAAILEIRVTDTAVLMTGDATGSLETGLLHSDLLGTGRFAIPTIVTIFNRIFGTKDIL